MFRQFDRVAKSTAKFLTSNTINARFGSSLRTTILLALVTCIGTALAAWTINSLAATPSSGTLTNAVTTLTYTGGPFFVANVSAQANGEPICNPALPCDDYTLTISVTPGTETTKRVRVKVEWPVPAADFDLYVYQGTTLVASAASSSDPEVLFLPALSAIYTIRTVPFAPAGQSYTGTITLEDIPPPPPPAVGIPPRYHNYPPLPTDLAGADSAGEPSIGVDWNIRCPETTPGCENLHPNAQFPKRNTGGIAFFTANLNEYRVTFDDCSSPAKHLWEDKTSPQTSLTSLDPIGLVDPEIGRVFQSQLTGVSSIIAFSDDDGESWTPSQGSGQPAGVDHQTLGGGPYNENSNPPPPPHPLYENQIYYASQDIGTAFAARSDDGGLTFGPGVPLWTILQCGGIHGHIKVGPDGTAYVPNRGCGGAQGVALSTDNGLTWTVRTVPDSTPGDTDPSVGIGTDNTLYLGYANGDGHPHMAMSTDQGLTWTDRDVGQGFIQNTVFPQAIAGDGDRAAFGFLGTPTSGNYEDTNNFRGVWHFYIATTFDRGNTYILVDATPNDPVQIGSICTSGTTCSGGDRNLLDFNDIQVDKEGRVLAAYADGCVAPACTSDTANEDPPYNTSRSSLSSIIRQSGGRRLFATFDPVEPAVPAAPRVESVTQDADGVAHLAWSEPDNGGSPLTGYKVYRKDGTGGTYVLLATVTLGCPDCKTTYDDPTAVIPPVDQYFYKVTARNAIGEGTNCGDFPLVPGPSLGTPCVLPGVGILTDPRGDIVVPVGTDSNPGWDVRGLWIAEPLALNPNRIVFTLKVESLAAVPPNTRWPVTFTSPDNVNYTVRMTNVVADGSTGTPIFQVGPTAGPFVAADPASNFNADGTITMVVPTSAIGNPQPGQNLVGFLTRICFSAGASCLTPDNMPDSLAPTGAYTLVGNVFCNTPPIAVVSATPTSGFRPLTVNFDGSASNDPDPGDSVVSYTFDFGDGTPVVTQPGPTISHIYTAAGNYQARLTVTDTYGGVSSPALVNIEVHTPCAGVDYLVTSSSGATIVPGTTQVPGSVCNVCTVTIPLPFTYSLYGTPYTQVVGSNSGTLQFTGNTSNNSNTCLPAASHTDTIFAYWDNLNTNIDDIMGIWTSVSGTMPNRVFNIEWRSGYEAADAVANFEVRLYEGQSKYDVIYGNVTRHGFSATVGVQQGNGAVRRTEYACNTANTIQNGQKLTFNLPPCQPGVQFSQQGPKLVGTGAVGTTEAGREVMGLIRFGSESGLKRSRFLSP